MLKEFFVGSGSVGGARFVAWGGVAVIIAHAVVHGWVKYAVNDWYRTFYDLLEEAGSLASNSSTTEAVWKQKQQRTFVQLLDFCRIAIVSVVVMPVFKYVRSMWALRWRIALMNAYTSSWNANLAPIEGASQRVHEDTYKFSRGIELCLTTVLDSLITLFVFVPVLASLGSETPCPSSMKAFAWFGDLWLVGIAVVSASVGFVVTMILGHKLVGLEVNNQVIEANLRKDLVVLETNPVAVCTVFYNDSVPDHPNHLDYPVDTDAPVSSTTQRSSTGILMPPMPHFIPLFDSIQRNYNRLFLNFSALNLWLSFFDQMNVILPYMVFAPLLFDADPEARIMLGTLVQVSNSFDKVFGSLSVVAENWGAINEFRSVLIRLRQFEIRIRRGGQFTSQQQARPLATCFCWHFSRRPSRMLLGGTPVELTVINDHVSSSTNGVDGAITSAVSRV